MTSRDLCVILLLVSKIQLTHYSVHAVCSVTVCPDHVDGERREQLYRSESARQMLKSVMHRRTDALFCKECNQTYQLAPPSDV